MIFEKTLPLILIFLIGIILKKKNILKKSDSDVLGRLLINLVIPVVIIDSFSAMVLSWDLIYLPVAGLIVVSSLMAIGFLLAHILKLKHATKGAFVTTFPTLEGGTLGYAFMLTAFGELGLSRIVLFDFANALFLFTVVYFVSCRFGNDHTKVSDAIAKMLKTPLVWAIFIGFFLNIIGFQNIVVSNLFDMIGGSVLLLIMLMLGVEFNPKFSSFKLPSLVILLKTSIGLGIGLIICSFFGLTGVERAAVLVGASLPPSIVTLLFSKENNLDTKYVANLLSLSIPFGALFLMVLLGFL